MYQSWFRDDLCIQYGLSSFPNQSKAIEFAEIKNKVNERDNKEKYEV